MELSSDIKCSNTCCLYQSSESRRGWTFQTNYQSWTRSQHYWEKTNRCWRRNIRDWKGKTQLLAWGLSSQDNPLVFGWIIDTFCASLIYTIFELEKWICLTSLCCLMSFEPVLLKSSGNKSQTLSNFQDVVYLEGWEGHNTASTLKTSQMVGSRIKWIISLPVLFKSAGSKIIRQHDIMIIKIPCRHK